MSDDTENPFPYPGARGLLSSGHPAPPVTQTDGGILGQALANAADAMTVMIFGNGQQRATVEAWMDRNRARRERA